MKMIVVCEGKNDFNFSKYLIEELGYNPEKEVLEYRYPGKQHKAGQSKKINSFNNKYSNENDCKFLIKEENGKRGVKIFLQQYISFDFISSINLIVIIDSDAGKPQKYQDDASRESAEKLLSYCKEKIEERYRSSGVKLNYKESSNLDNEIIYSVDLAEKKKPAVSFRMIFFKKTFEQAAKIQKEEDDECVIEKKIREYAERKVLDLGSLFKIS